MHERARTVYYSLRGRDQERFLATFARLNGEAAARAIEPGYRLTAVAVGVRGALCAGKALNTTQAVPCPGRAETRGGGIAGVGDRDQASARGNQDFEVACLSLGQTG